MKLVTNTETGWSALFSDDETLRFRLERPIERYPDGDEDGPRCRDCADNAGVCPHDGWPCWSKDERIMVSCGINPSTADAFKNDQTVTKDSFFAWREKCGRLIKVNAYAWRNKSIKGMFDAQKVGADIVGFGSGNPVIGSNDQAIESALTMAKKTGGIAIAAWGNHVPALRALELSRIAARVGIEWMCFGMNKNGSPKHTCYLAHDSKLVPWRP